MARFEHRFIYANIILRMPEHPYLTEVLRMLYFDQNTYSTGVYIICIPPEVYIYSGVFIYFKRIKLYSTVTQHPLPEQLLTNGLNKAIAN